MVSLNGGCLLTEDGIVRQSIDPIEKKGLRAATFRDFSRFEGLRNINEKSTCVIGKSTINWLVVEPPL